MRNQGENNKQIQKRGKGVAVVAGKVKSEEDRAAAPKKKEKSKTIKNH
jgi:hypothetical protein